jgi:predicted porin
MKKSLVALAVGAAFAAPAAFADVTIRGAINMGVEYLNVGKASDAAGGGDSVSNFGVASNYSNVTISSMEDLGGGLKLDFAYQITAPTQSVGGVSNRNSHIGLVSDSWGGVWYGSNENIYERYYYTNDPLDGAAGLGGNLQMMGTVGGAVFSTCGGSPSNVIADGSVTGTTATRNSCGATWYRRDEQVIWYDSPNWNGFTFGAVWQTNYGKSHTASGGSINPSMWQLGAKYAGTSLPLEVWGAYGNRKDQFGLLSIAGVVAGQAGVGGMISADSSKDTAWQLGGAYTLGDVRIFVMYEQLKYKLDGLTATDGVTTVTADSVALKRNAYGIGLKWNLASGYFGAQFITASKMKFEADGASTDLDDTGANMIGVGYYHNMSKQTQAYVVGSVVDNKDFATYGTAGIGNAAQFANPGAQVWGLGVGLKHSF